MCTVVLGNPEFSHTMGYCVTKTHMQIFFVFGCCWGFCNTSPATILVRGNSSNAHRILCIDTHTLTCTSQKTFSLLFSPSHSCLQNFPFTVLSMGIFGCAPKPKTIPAHNIRPKMLHLAVLNILFG